MPIVYVAAGGAIGAVLRYLAVLFAAKVNPGSFPIGTLLVNLVGSFLIGLLMVRFGQSEPARLFLITGILGGFTTFSAFSWDTLQLLQRGEFAAAVIYVIGSVALSFVAVMIGFELGR